MKKFLVFASLAALTLTGCFTNYAHREKQTGTENYKASLYTKVILETQNGAIEATAVPGDSNIRVELTRWATGFSQSDALEHLSGIKVTVNQDTAAKVLSIIVTMPEITTYSLGCDAVISLPESLYVDLESSNGKISADGHKNGLRLRTSNGEVDLKNTEGVASLETSNGAINISDHTGNIDAQTSNGKISLKNTNGDATLETSNGAITVSMHNGNIEAKTSNAAVDADVIMPVKDGTCKFSSSNGAIELAVPDSVGATIWLETTNASITVTGFSQELGDFNQDDHIFESKMGDESGTIDLRTSNGAITFKKL